MSVVRIKKTENFVILSKECLENTNLSFKAKGLWAYCMSRPNDWEFKVKHLITVSKEGEDAVYSALKELEAEGYCQKMQQNKKGRFQSVDYEMHETKIFKKCLPQPDFPDAGNPRAGNPALLSNEQTKDKKEKKKRAPAVPPIALNSDTKKFEGITDEDIKRWQDTYPAVNIRKELPDCLIWALSNPRNSYRKSIDKWMRNKNQSHTTAFKPQNSPVEVSEEEKKENIRIAEKWENDYQGKGGIHYDVHAKSSKVDFILPNNESYSVEYDQPTKEFLRLCQKAIKRMKL